MRGRGQSEKRLEEEATTGHKPRLSADEVNSDLRGIFMIQILWHPDVQLAAAKLIGVLCVNVINRSFACCVHRLFMGSLLGSLGEQSPF